MLFSVEQAFVGREEIRAPLKTPAWEARFVFDQQNIHRKIIIRISGVVKLQRITLKSKGAVSEREILLKIETKKKDEPDGLIKNMSAVKPCFNGCQTSNVWWQNTSCLAPI